MKTSHLPHMVILGAPIGDYLFCANFIASKRLDAVKLLSKLVEVATIDPQVALILLRCCLGVKVEVGSRLTPDLRQTRPADVLVADWERGRPAAWDVIVASPLTPAVLNEAGMTAGAAAAASEQRKHIANDPKCQELVFSHDPPLASQNNVTVLNELKCVVVQTFCRGPLNCHVVSWSAPDGSLVPRENATEMQRLVAYEDHECTPSLTAGEKREAAALLKRAAPIKA
eukprot:Em0017g321a